MLLASEAVERVGAEARVRGERYRGGTAGLRDLLHDDDEARHVHSRAAVVLGNVRAEESQFAHLLESFQREDVLLVKLGSARLELVLREIAHGVAQNQMLFSEIVHGQTPLPGAMIISIVAH